MKALVLLLVGGCGIGPAIYVERVGEGDVRSMPEGIHCGSDCAMIVDDGTITLIAEPKAGSRFVGWDREGCDAPFCKIELAGDTHVTAVFEEVVHTVTIVPTGGTVIVNKYTHCAKPCEFQLRDGVGLHLEAPPTDGAVISHWTDVCEGSSTTCMLTVDRSTTIEAVFAPMHALTVQRHGPGTVEATGIHCGWDCTERYRHGTKVTLVATPAADATFVGWEGACSGTGACGVTIGGATTVIAKFQRICEVVTQSESAAAFNARLASPNTAVCLADGVTISGPVVIGANGIDIRALPGATARIVNPSGTAIDFGGHTTIRIEGIDVRSGGAQYTTVTNIGTGAIVDIVGATITCEATACDAVLVSNGAVRIDRSTIVGSSAGLAVFGTQSAVVMIEDSTVTSYGWAAIGMVSGTLLELRTSTVRAATHAVYAGGPGLPVTLRLDGNTVQKLAGTTTSQSPILSDRDHTLVHSQLSNTFCNEGASTVDGEFVQPLVGGPYAAASSFNAISHSLGACP